MTIDTDPHLAQPGSQPNPTVPETMPLGPVLAQMDGIANPLATVALQVGGDVTTADQAAALVSAFSSGGIVTAVDAEGLGAYVAGIEARDENAGAALSAEVSRLLRSQDRTRFEQAVEDNRPGFFGRLGNDLSGAFDWVTSRPDAFRQWHDGYDPNSFLGHVGDGLATVGVGVLDIAEFASGVAETANDLGPLGQGARLIEQVWGTELPAWIPNAEDGEASLRSAGQTVAALAENPGLIWDGLTSNYTKLWAEERYGGLVGQVVADFGDILLGSKGAGRAGGALSDLARAGKLGSLDELSDVLTAARRADAVAPGEFVNIVDELAAIKRADGGLDELVEAARRTDTLPDLLGRGVLSRTEIDDLIRSGALSLDEAARARVGAGGSRYAEDISTPEEIAAYDAIAARTDDIASIAGNLGIGADVVARVKQHLFFDVHEIPTGPGQTARGNFSPMAEISDPWIAAAEGRLAGDELASFKRLLSHEYVEARLMEQGLPYRSAHPDAYDAVKGFEPTPEHFGAHDLAPLGDHGRAPFAIYDRVLGLDTPRLDIADDLSNLDDVVAEILDIIE